MYYVNKLVVVALEKNVKLDDEQHRTFYRKGYFVQEIKYYVAKDIEESDKEKIRAADLVVVCYKNKISNFGQQIIKHAATSSKKIVIKQKIKSADL